MYFDRELLRTTLKKEVHYEYNDVVILFNVASTTSNCFNYSTQMY